MDPLTVGQNKPLTFTRLVRVPYHGNRKNSSDSVQSSLLLSCQTEPTVSCKFWVPSLLLSGSSPRQGSTFLFHLHHVSQVTPPLDIPYHPSYAAVSLHNDITTVGTEVLLSASLVTSLWKAQSPPSQPWISCSSLCWPLPYLTLHWLHWAWAILTSTPAKAKSYVRTKSHLMQQSLCKVWHRAGSVRWMTRLKEKIGYWQKSTKKPNIDHIRLLLWG